MVMHLSTNGTQHRLTLLMLLLALSLGQTATHSFTANTNRLAYTSLKYSIQFNVVHKLFTEIRFPYALFRWTFHWKQNLELNISVNASLKIEYLSLFQWSHSLKIEFHILHFSELFTENRHQCPKFQWTLHWK